MESKYAIEVVDISRQFVDKKHHATNLALKDVSFKVKKGTIHGLIGPNGAGKSTTMKILSTLLLPTKGQAFINGIEIQDDLAAIRKNINFVYGGERDLYWRLSGTDNLRYFVALYGLDKTKQKKLITDLLELVGLTKAKDRLVETYSKGMKQRLQIARGLLNDPQVLLLDEPTIGLDQESAEVFKEIVQKLVDRGKSILFSSHYLEEVETLCDTITILNHGQVVADGTPFELKSVFKDDLQFELIIDGKENDSKRLLSEPLAENVSEIAFNYRFRSDLTEVTGVLHGDKSALAQKFVQNICNNDKVRKFVLTTPSLDRIYKYYTTNKSV